MMDHLNNIHRENCVLCYSVQEFIEIKVWWLLTYTINWFLYILLSYIKGCRYFQIMIQLWYKFCFSLRTSFKELIWCTDDPNVHIHIFQKHERFIWGCFFPVSIFNSWMENHRHPSSTLSSKANRTFSEK